MLGRNEKDDSLNICHACPFEILYWKNRVNREKRGVIGDHCGLDSGVQQQMDVGKVKTQTFLPGLGCVFSIGRNFIRCVAADHHARPPLQTILKVSGCFYALSQNPLIL